MIITPSNDNNNSKDDGASTALQDELSALRERKIAKSTVWSNKPAKSLSFVVWQEQQRALKEKERDLRNKSRKLMESYKAVESTHFDFQQKELTPEVTEEERNGLKAKEENCEKGPRVAIELSEDDDQNDTDDTAVIENEGLSEDEKEAEEENDVVGETESEIGVPEKEKIKEVEEETLTAPSSPVLSCPSSCPSLSKNDMISCPSLSNSSRKDVIISVSKGKKRRGKKNIIEDHSVATTQEMIDYHENGNEALCGCVIL